MAEGILRTLLARENIQDVQTASAGIMAFEGNPAEPFAVAVCGKKDVDISGHRSTMLTRSMLEESNLVLTMEKMQYLIVRGMIPNDKGKMFLLTAYGGDGSEDDIEDPIARDIEAFDDCYNTLHMEILRILPLVIQAAHDWKEKK